MYKVQFPRAKPDNAGEKIFVVPGSACAKQCADSICLREMLYKVQLPRAEPDNAGEKIFVVPGSVCAKQCTDSICQKTPTSLKKERPEFLNDIGQKFCLLFVTEY